MKTVPIATADKCDRCKPSICCGYFTQAIDTPRSKSDFDFLLWQIAHRDVQVYKDKGAWYLLINNPCTHLQVDGRCGIYETRPKICRDYSNDYCEYDQPADGDFQLFFKDYDALLRYYKRRFKQR